HPLLVPQQIFRGKPTVLRQADRDAAVVAAAGTAAVVGAPGGIAETRRVAAEAATRVASASVAAGGTDERVLVAEGARHRSRLQDHLAFHGHCRSRVELRRLGLADAAGLLHR